MAEGRYVSVLDLCCARALEVEPNRWKAMKLAGWMAAFVDEWARMVRESGNEAPTLEQWAEWACVNERTAYRRLADFRRLFGEWHSDPTVLARHMNRGIAERARGDIPAELVPA